MADRGRPTKLTKEIQDEMMLMLKMGNYMEAAAAYSGISKTTAYKWMKRGRRELDRVNAGTARKVKKSEQIYVDFMNAIEKAMAESEIRDVQIIYNAGKSDWKSSAWRLERKYPDRWGRKDRHEVTGKDGGDIKVDMTGARQKLIAKLGSIAKAENDHDVDANNMDDNNSEGH